MPDYTYDGSDQPLYLSKRVTLFPSANLRGAAHVHTADECLLPDGLVSFSTLGGAEPASPQDSAPVPAPSMPLSIFHVTEAPITLDMLPSPAPVHLPSPSFSLSTPEPIREVATIAYQPEPGEEVACALLHELHTPDGIIYDITLPKPADEPVSFSTGYSGESQPLYFPIFQPVQQGCEHDRHTPADESAVSFGLGDSIAGFVREVPIKQVLHILHTPVEHQLLHAIAKREPIPCVRRVERDGSPGTPMDGASAWRSLFPPSRNHRVLFFIHGFGSDSEGSLPRTWMRAFAPHYDGVLSYDHPTITRDPLTNARELLDMIPDDIRMDVDLVVHSRGGLVARSLIELLPSVDTFRVRRLVTCGSPHGGTELARRAHWDRMISIGLTAQSLFSATAGARAAMTFLPTMLESLLQAASQFVFTLPGLEAMDPDSPFIKKLNELGNSSLAERVTYAAVTSSFDAESVPHRNFREALMTMGTQVFLQTPNDLVVPTQSMQYIDPGSSLLGDRVYQVNVNHFEYFDRADVQDFVWKILSNS